MERELQDFKNRTFLTIRYDEETKWIYNTWDGLVTINEVKRGSQACLEVLEEKQATIVINDNRKLLTNWESLRGWIEREWIPHAMESGLECLAQIVNPAFNPNHEVTHIIKEKAILNFRIEIFYDIETAKRWILHHDCKD